jgi:nitroreductase
VTDLERAMLDRRSTRLFLPDRPVPRALVNDALRLAVHAPSNSNIQPWRLVLATGRARDRLVDALLARAAVGPPRVPELPESFAHLRRELGALVYGSMGIDRSDRAARRAAVLRNYEFFRAPLAGVVGMPRDLGVVDALGVGMFLQNLLLALTARGLGTCVEVSIAGYPRRSVNSSAWARSCRSSAVSLLATRTRTSPPTPSECRATRSTRTSRTSTRSADADGRPSVDP